MHHNYICGYRTFAAYPKSGEGFVQARQFDSSILPHPDEVVSAIYFPKRRKASILTSYTWADYKRGGWFGHAVRTVRGLRLIFQQDWIVTDRQGRVQVYKPKAFWKMFNVPGYLERGDQ
jgi:hypothetical protein